MGMNIHPQMTIAINVTSSNPIEITRKWTTGVTSIRRKIGQNLQMSLVSTIYRRNLQMLVFLQSNAGERYIEVRKGEISPVREKSTGFLPW